MKNTALRERALSSVSRIMLSPKRKQALPRDLAECAAGLVAPDIVKTGRATIVRGRLCIAPEARSDIAWLARNLAWMANPDHHHGQQATERANKTIRALRSGKVSVAQLWEQTAEFGRLRKKHIDRNSAERPRAEPRSLSLGGWTARWLTSKSEIDATGHQMANCLANKTYGDEYKAGLRNGDVELVVLEEEESGESEALLSARDGGVDQVKGPWNSRPIRCREAIIGLLMTAPNLLVGECSDLLEMAICDPLVRGRADGATTSFTIAKRTCEVGAGFLAVTSSDFSLLLRWDNDSPWDPVSCVIHVEDDVTAMTQSSTRVWLQEACRRRPEFAQACAKAFRHALRDFRLDWFGAPHRASK